MNLSKQQQAGLVSLLMIIGLAVAVYFIEDVVIKISIVVIGLVLLWLILRTILKKPSQVKLDTRDFLKLASDLVPLLGGKQNIEKIEHCQTRVLLTVKDSSLANIEAIRKLGIAGVLRPSNTKIQLIVKQFVDPLYAALRDAI